MFGLSFGRKSNFQKLNSYYTFRLFWKLLSYFHKLFFDANVIIGFLIFLLHIIGHLSTNIERKFMYSVFLDFLDFPNENLKSSIFILYIVNFFEVSNCVAFVTKYLWKLNFSANRVDLNGNKFQTYLLSLNNSKPTVPSKISRQPTDNLPLIHILV